MWFGGFKYICIFNDPAFTGRKYFEIAEKGECKGSLFLKPDPAGLGGIFVKVYSFVIEIILNIAAYYGIVDAIFSLIDRFYIIIFYFFFDFRRSFSTSCQQKCHGKECFVTSHIARTYGSIICVAIFILTNPLNCDILSFSS